MKRSAISVLITASLVALAGSAHAVIYEISVKNRNFCCTNPPFFIAGVPWSKAGYHTIVATASQSGVAPQTIKIGVGHAANLYSMFFLDVPSVPYDKTNFGTASFRNGAGTLQKNGGNAVTFSFCPKHIGLPAPGACTKASKATPISQGFNGRVKVTPGKNHFGGTLQILAGPGGIGGTQWFVYRFVGKNNSWPPAQLLQGGFDLAPIGATAPGDAVSLPQPVMTGFKATGFMTMSYPNQALWEQGAGRFTTGMVTLQITMQKGPLPVRSVKLAGYDNRTPSGLGNIQLVSGLLANGLNGAAPGGTPLGWKMRIRFVPEPATNLGFAAGGLGLLLVGALNARGARPRRFAILVLIAASLVALAGSARAVVYEISVKNRIFCCTNPPLFVFGIPGFMGDIGYHTVVATASQTGVAPQPVKIGMGHAAHFYSMSVYDELPWPPSLWQFTGTASLSNAAGTLQKGGGNPVSFSFCPKNIGLPAPGACTHPAKATPKSQGFNGRIKVTPGKNKFGGTLQILAGPGGIGGNKFVAYRGLGPSFDPPIAVIRGGFDLAPIGAMTPGYIAIEPNPVMTGFSATGFMTMSNPNQALWEQGAGPFTTGMVTLQITMQLGPLPVRSLMLAGYDNRTPGGLGNIQLVSGTLANAVNSSMPSGTPLGHRMTIRFIPEPTASLGLAAGALGLLLVGLLRTRRR